MEKNDNPDGKQKTARENAQVIDHIELDDPTAAKQTVPVGTAQEKLNLPGLKVQLEDGNTAVIQVSWEIKGSSYNPDKAGDYTLSLTWAVSIF